MPTHGLSVLIINRFPMLDFKYRIYYIQKDRRRTVT